MQYYVYVNDVLLLGFGPEISSIFIEIQLSPKVMGIVLNCKFYIDTIHNQELETRCIYRLLHYIEILMRSPRPTENSVSSGMLNEEIDGGSVPRIFALLDVVQREKKEMLKGTTPHSQYEGQIGS